MSVSMLEAVGLDFDYEGVPALCGMHLRIRQGMKIALLGANGSGKTTLLLHLNGTLRPKRGKVLLHGQAVTFNRSGIRSLLQSVGLVLQNPDDQLFAATVKQDVSFGPLNLDLPENEVRQRVDEALDALSIADLADRSTHRLSFGQKKRVALAGAMAMRPEVLLLDEPTAGLDPVGAQEMRTALDRLQSQGTTLVLATQDMDLALEWADELAVLHQGKVLCQGDPSELLQDHELIKEARLRMPCLLETLNLLRKAGVPIPQDSKCRFSGDLVRLLLPVLGVACEP